MVRHHPGLTSLLVSLKDLFLVHCCSWYISMIYQMTYPPILTYSQMIPLLFSVVHNKNTSVKELNNDLLKISNRANQWNMSFNPDPLKQAQEVIFSGKITKTNHPTLIFNDNPAHQVALQKRLWRFLDRKLNFEERIKTIFNKINKNIGLLHKFQNFLPRKSLLTIYRSIIRPHLE